MKEIRTRYLASIAVLLFPVTANAVPIEISGYGEADGNWDVTALLCDLTEQSCIDALAGQVWYQNGYLARAFADSCYDCLGYLNGPFGNGGYTPFVNDLPYVFNGTTYYMGYGYAFGNSVLFPFSSYDSEAYFMVAQRTSVPEPGTIALFGIGLAAMGLVRRRKAKSLERAASSLRLNP